MRSHDAAMIRCALAILTIAIVGPVSGGVPAPFTEEAQARGITFVMSGNPQTQGYLGQGSGFVDLDNDGDPDVILIGRVSGQVGIYENDGTGVFTDHSATSGIPLLQQQQGFAVADYDADGLLDIYLTQAINRPNLLLKNNGNFTFTDVAITSGTGNGPFNSTGPSWGDYNDDGWPDIYVCNYGQANALYRNNGNGTFSNVAGGLGLTASTHLSFQTVWSDYDRDGDVDLYLSNDRAELGWPPNVLWRNDGGTFTDVSAASGADVAIYSMGLGAGDLDNNLYPDLYVTNITSVEGNGSTVDYDGVNPLLMNQGDGTFLELEDLWGVTNDITSWGAVFFDYDNDGYKDLYVNNQFEPNSLFECDGVPPCTEVAAQLGIGASYDTEYDLQTDPPEIASFVTSVGDVDLDGDLDALVNNLGSRAELFINHEGETRNWVRYDVVGEHPNTFAIGGNVETTAGGFTQFHEIYSGGNGYLGQNELVLTVGLGEAETVDQAVFQWPGGGPTRTLTGLPAKQTWKIYAPSRLCDADGDGVDYDDFVGFAGCFIAGLSPGCEMMDFDGDSGIQGDDLDSCFVSTPADCNSNGTEDVAEIMLDLGLDADQNYLIDCCEAGTPTNPNPVGNTLLLDKTGADEPMLSWQAPATDPTHDPATSYDVFRATELPGSFGVLGNSAGPTLTDADTAPQRAYYLVGARNGCGSSGEEPF